ncbi:hypothetical protein ACQEVC_36160 [Plantactinospora sp. CA-294935]|uniref:hypothetical protein n=1 Tax=Plantactinospora sp. CA-294935 TaxID=3240012 RepID=UPI003D8B07C3
MPPGRLAFTWFAEDEADCAQRDFVVLVDAAWKAVQTVTSPHIETAEGTPFRRYRIGPAAKARALDRPDLLRHDHALRLRIRPVRRVPDNLRAG